MTLAMPMPANHDVRESAVPLQSMAGGVEHHHKDRAEIAGEQSGGQQVDDGQAN